MCVPFQSMFSILVMGGVVVKALMLFMSDGWVGGLGGVLLFPNGKRWLYICLATFDQVPIRSVCCPFRLFY